MDYEHARIEESSMKNYFAEIRRLLGHLPRVVVNSCEEWSPSGQHNGKKQVMLDINN